MSRKLNVINNIITIIFTVVVSYICFAFCVGKFNKQLLELALPLVLGLILVSFLQTFFHELGHLFFGKLNGFVLISFRVWFVKFYRRKNKIKTCFSKLNDAAGATEMVAKNSNNLLKRFKSMTFGGLLFSFLSMLLGLIAIFVDMPYWLACIIILFLPVGCYSVLGNLLTIEEYGYKNDGATLLGLKKQDDNSKIIVGLLNIQSQLFNGKTPSEIDQNFYFDLPQLPEDNSNFLSLLIFRYYYYLDKGDYAEALKIIQRLLTLEMYMTKDMQMGVKTEALYMYSAHFRDEQKVDDLMYELEDYLNKNNTASVVRAKLAYILFIGEENADVNLFYKKGIKEAKKCPILGLKNFEIKLLDKLK